RMSPHRQFLVVRRPGHRPVDAGEMAAARLVPGPDGRRGVSGGVGHGVRAGCGCSRTPYPRGAFRAGRGHRCGCACAAIGPSCGFGHPPRCLPPMKDRPMRKLITLALRPLLSLVLLLLAGCGTTPYRPSASPCSENPGGRDCEIERYLILP